MRRIGDSDFPPDDYGPLESHIETCPACQATLQAWADADRLTHERHDPACFDSESVESDPPIPPLPGFRLIRELGRGGEGVVHLAEEVETQRLVALKFLPGGWLVDTAGRGRWLRQVRAAARIAHPNVVRLYGIEETSRWYVMVLEYVPGGTLRDRVRQPIAERDAVAIVRRLASAVEDIHSAGVWHLDLKPSNVLLEGPESAEPALCVPKIADFGIALRLGGSSIESIPGGGTPGFMAPEQADERIGPIGPAADVYGLGAILHYLLTTRPPVDVGHAFEAERPETVRTGDAVEPATRAVEPALWSICRKALALRPAARYCSPGELADALAGWERGRLTTDTVATRSSRSRGFVSQLSRPALTVTILAICGIGALAVTFANRGEVSRQAAGPGESLTKSQWLEELRQVEPSVFFGDRLDRLIASSKAHTGELLAHPAGDAEEMARAGVMLQAMATRFGASTYKHLFDKSEDLLGCAVRLLERSDRISPGNQATIRELAIAELSFSAVKAQELAFDDGEVARQATEDVRHLERAAGWIDRLTDRRMRCHLASLVLDRIRDQSRDAESKEFTASMAVWSDAHRRSAIRWADLSDDDSISARMALFDRDEFGRSTGHEDGDPAVRLALERELVMYRFVPLVIRRRADRPDPTAAEIAATMESAATLLERFGRESGTIPRIVYEELIRPVATISTWYRAQRRLEESGAVARRYLELIQAVDARYPNRYECDLALSEAYLQLWKNATKAEDRTGAEAALRTSLDMAQRATAKVPGDVTARSMLEDRQSRLARFRADEGR